MMAFSDLRRSEHQATHVCVVFCNHCVADQLPSASSRQVCVSGSVVVVTTSRYAATIVPKGIVY